MRGPADLTRRRDVDSVLVNPCPLEWCTGGGQGAGIGVGMWAAWWWAVWLDRDPRSLPLLFVVTVSVGEEVEVSNV